MSKAVEAAGLKAAEQKNCGTPLTDCHFCYCECDVRAAIKAALKVRDEEWQMKCGIFLKVLGLHEATEEEIIAQHGMLGLDWVQRFHRLIGWEFGSRALGHGEEE